MAASRFSKSGRLVLLAALAALFAGTLLLTRFDAGLLMMLPALVMLAVFVVWPYPGLDLILRIAARRPRRRPTRARPATRPRDRGPLRGGRLIAASLGGRAPPLPCRI